MEEKAKKLQEKHEKIAESCAENVLEELEEKGLLIAKPDNEIIKSIADSISASYTLIMMSLMFI